LATGRDGAVTLNAAQLRLLFMGMNWMALSTNETRTAAE